MKEPRRGIWGLDLKLEKELDLDEIIGNSNLVRLGGVLCSLGEGWGEFESCRRLLPSSLPQHKQEMRGLSDLVLTPLLADGGGWVNA